MSMVNFCQLALILISRGHPNCAKGHSTSIQHRFLIHFWFPLFRPMGRLSTSDKMVCPFPYDAYRAISPVMHSMGSTIKLLPPPSLLEQQAYSFFFYLCLWISLLEVGTPHLNLNQTRSINLPEIRRFISISATAFFLTLLCHSSIHPTLFSGLISPDFLFIQPPTSGPNSCLSIRHPIRLRWYCNCLFTLTQLNLLPLYDPSLWPGPWPYCLHQIIHVLGMR